MNSEKSNTDIMADILGSQSEAPAAQADDLERIIYRNPQELKQPMHRAFRLTDAAQPAMPEDLKRLVLPDKDDEDQEHSSFRLTDIVKKKTTIYFSKKIHLMLKSAKYQIKKMIEPELQSQISMSSIINNALIIVLHEFDLKREKSILYRQIIRKLKKEETTL